MMKQVMTSKNTGDSCEEVLALIPAYAFRATDPEETAFVEANLDACPQAADTLEDFTRLAAEMRVDVPQVAPASDLEARLMARLSAAERGQVRPVPPARSRSLWRALAAAAAVIALFIGTNAYWLMRVNNLNQEKEALAAQVREADAYPVEWLTRAQWRRLEGTEDSSVLAVIIWEDRDCFLYTLGMPDLPADKVYQLWLVESNNRHVSAGTFRVDERGRGTLGCHWPDAEGFVRVGITTEPRGGSTDPTGNPVALGDV
jgi:anti-sigma-K factor RskA